MTWWERLTQIISLNKGPHSYAHCELIASASWNVIFIITRRGKKVWKKVMNVKLLAVPWMFSQSPTSWWLQWSIEQLNSQKSEVQLGQKHRKAVWKIFLYHSFLNKWLIFIFKHRLIILYVSLCCFPHPRTPLLCSTRPSLWSPKEVAPGARTQTTGVLPSTQRPWPQYSGRQPSGGDLSQKPQDCSRYAFSPSHTHWHTHTHSQPPM